jgi:hypothetical protein
MVAARLEHVASDCRLRASCLWLGPARLRACVAGGGHREGTGGDWRGRAAKVGVTRGQETCVSACARARVRVRA